MRLFQYKDQSNLLPYACKSGYLKIAFARPTAQVRILNSTGVHWECHPKIRLKGSPERPDSFFFFLIIFCLHTSLDHHNCRQRQQHTPEVSTHQTQSSSSVSPVQRKFPSVLGYHKYFHTCDAGITKITAICWTYRIIYSLSILYLFPNQSCLSHFTAWLLNFPISTCSCSACWGGGRNCWALVAIRKIQLPNPISLAFFDLQIFWSFPEPLDVWGYMLIQRKVSLRLHVKLMSLF